MTFKLTLFGRRETSRKRQQQSNLIKETRKMNTREIGKYEAMVSQRRCRELSDNVKRSKRNHIFSRGPSEFVSC